MRAEDSWAAQYRAAQRLARLPPRKYAKRSAPPFQKCDTLFPALMNVQTVIVSPQSLLAPLLAPLVGQLLLPETSTASKPANPWSFGPESFTFRATKISVAVKEMLEQRGHPHGGIND
jgi:hypothetical protein